MFKNVMMMKGNNSVVHNGKLYLWDANGIYIYNLDLTPTGVSRTISVSDLMIDDNYIYIVSTPTLILKLNINDLSTVVSKTMNINGFIGATNDSIYINFGYSSGNNYSRIRKLNKSNLSTLGFTTSGIFEYHTSAIEHNGILYVGGKKAGYVTTSGIITYNSSTLALLSSYLETRFITLMPGSFIDNGYLYELTSPTTYGATLGNNTTINKIDISNMNIVDSYSITEYGYQARNMFFYGGYIYYNYWLSNVIKIDTNTMEAISSYSLPGIPGGQYMSQYGIIDDKMIVGNGTTVVKTHNINNGDLINTLELGLNIHRKYN